jgi:hypothetical protein
MLCFDICLLKKAPQDLPYSTNLLKILVIINIVVNFLLSNIGIGRFDALMKVIVGVLLMVVFSWISLFFVKKLGRFCQTTSALLGTDTIISFFSLPAIATIAINQAGLLAFLLMIVLIIWYWIVTGHIMRNALEQSFGFSLGLAFLYLLVSYQVTTFIIP